MQTRFPNSRRSKVARDPVVRMTEWLRKGLNHEPSLDAIKQLYGHNPHILIDSLVDHLISFRDIVDDHEVIRAVIAQVLELDAHIAANPTNVWFSSEGAISESLVNLRIIEPFRMFSKPDFDKFILYVCKKVDEPTAIDLTHLKWFVSELKPLLETMCPRDREILDKSGNMESIEESFFNISRKNTHFMLLWSALEASKFCSIHKLISPTGLPTEILQIIAKRLIKPVTFAEKLPASLLCQFIWFLYRAINEQVSHWASPVNSMPIGEGISDSIKAHSATVMGWFESHVLDITKLHSTLDLSAACVLYSQWRLQNDLYKRIDQLYAPVDGERLIYNRENPLLTINNVSLESNVELLSLGARNLNDILLLEGVKRIMKQGVILPDYKFVTLVLNNMEGRYLQTIKTFHKHGEMAVRDQISIIEYLTASIEYSDSKNLKPYVELLQDTTTRHLYEAYLESRDHKLASSSIDVDKINDWLTTWTDTDVSNTISINDRIELMLPTRLNIIARKPIKERQKSLDQLDWILGQNLISESFSTIGRTSRERFKIYHILIQLLRSETPRIPLSYVQVHSKDLSWHQRMYRHVTDLGLVNQLRVVDDCMDIIQYKAAKFYKSRGDPDRAIIISNDLIESSTRPEYKVLAKILQIKTKNNNNSASGVDYLTTSDCLAPFSLETKTEFRLKLLRHLLKSNVTCPNHWTLDLRNIQDYIDPIDHINDKQPMNVVRWMAILNMSQLDSRVKTIRQFARRIEQQINRKETDDEHLSINSLFGMHLRLIQYGCQLAGNQFKQWTLESAIAILRLVQQHNSVLSKENFEHMHTEEFIVRTLNIWIDLRGSLIAIAIADKTVSASWRTCLITILELIVSKHSQYLLYEIISNRINTDYVANFDEEAQRSPNTEESNLWARLLEKLMFDKTSKIQQSVIDTQDMVVELRNIGFLRGDVLRILCEKLPRVLYAFFTRFAGACLTKNLIDKKRQMDLCSLELVRYVIRANALITHLLRDSDCVTNLTKYEAWFVDSFKKNLHEMAYRLRLLNSSQPIERVQASQMLRLIRSITSLASLCRNHLIDYNNKMRNLLYLEVINSKLSNLFASSLILMPDCHTKEIPEQLIHIHKVAETIDLLPSKTLPKRVRFVGSDGQTKSFLLKSNEDLRLDKQMMTSLRIINKFILVDKKLQSEQLRLRIYSVTPIGPMCGLIEWIESRSLGSIVRAWQNSSNGHAKMQKLYSETCNNVCKKTNEKHHDNCKFRPNTSIIDPFYQRLWAKTISLKSSNDKSLIEKRPNLSLSRKLRSSIEPAIFESVIESLINDSHPRELITSQLWHRSSNPHAYWLKHKNFVNSCASMSIVGYIIGLGDRHLENILLDERTGELIHVDYGICFELGRKLPLPEVVPFRLTPGIIYAMGFGGLEGRFTRISYKLLETLRNKSSTVSQLFDPVHFWFLERADAVKTSRLNHHAMNIDANAVSGLLNLENNRLNDSNGPSDIETVFHRSCSMSDVLNKQISVSNHPGKFMLRQEQQSTNKPAGRHNEIHSQESISIVIGDDDAEDDLIEVEISNLVDKNDFNTLIEMDTQVVQRRHLFEEPMIPTRITDSQLQVATVATCGSPNDSLRAGPMSIFSYELRPYEKNLNQHPMSRVDLIAIHRRIVDKLSGTDELLRNYVESSKSDRSNSVDSSHGASDLQITSESAESSNRNDDLICLDFSQSIEEQLGALIKQATMLRNYSLMFEGWMAWF